MNLKEQIMKLISDSRAELSLDKSYNLLIEALKISDEYLLENPIDGAYEKAHILRELAYEESKIDKRYKRWRESLNVLEKAIRIYSDYRLIENFSFFVVDSLQDEYGGISANEQTRDLKTAYSFIESCLKDTKEPTQKSMLLSRKASIIKHLAFQELSEPIKKKQLDKSVACADLAVKTFATANNILELALCEWALANHEDSDKATAKRLTDAETHLKHKLLSNNEDGILSLSRFYRLNFKPKKCCEVFPKSIEGCKNVRKLLRSVNIYAEAIISLWYAKYPEDYINEHLLISKNLLETSLSAGYNNARNIVDLAFIQSILGSYKDGLITLTEINLEQTKSIDWKFILNNIQNQTDVAFKGFALGIDSCGIWTKLGTYAKTFLEDIHLAEAMYRTAIKFDKKNSIALTNLARLLIENYEDEETIIEVRRLLQKAGEFADRRFCWWREVQSKLEDFEKEDKTYSIKRLYIPFGENSITNIKQIRKKYHEIMALESPQERGDELEKLFYELARITFGVAKPAYTIHRISEGIQQIDGYFEFDPDRYRVECKWEKKNVNKDAVLSFFDRIDNTSGVSGIIISMSDFTSTAIGLAREKAAIRQILLINGLEMDSVFSGRMNFDELIEIKRSYFFQYREPYFRVIGDKADEEIV